MQVPETIGFEVLSWGSYGEFELELDRFVEFLDTWEVFLNDDTLNPLQVQRREAAISVFREGRPLAVLSSPPELHSSRSVIAIATLLVCDGVYVWPVWESTFVMPQYQMLETRLITRIVRTMQDMIEAEQEPTEAKTIFKVCFNGTVSADIAKALERIGMSPEDSDPRTFRGVLNDDSNVVAFRRN